MNRVHAILVPMLLVAATAGLPGRPAGAQEATGAKSPAGASPRVIPGQAIKPIDTTSPGAEPPPRGFRFEATMPDEQQGAREQEFYAGYAIKTIHNPAFIQPFVMRVRTSPTSSGRLGLSGWTVPAAPFDIPQASGDVAVGLTFTWGDPVVEKEGPAPASPGQR